MTITLDAYLKDMPLFEGFLSEEVGLKLAQTHKDYVTYKWYPKNRENVVYVHSFLNPSCYSCLTYYANFDIDKFAARKALEGIFLPQDFLKKVKGNRGAVIADEEMNAILGRHPDLEKGLWFHQPLWGILRFTEGNPTHSVSLEAQYSVDNETLDSMAILTHFIATRYHGIAWDPQTRLFGKPNPRTLDQIRMLAFRDFASSIDPSQFEIVSA